MRCSLASKRVALVLLLAGQRRRGHEAISQLVRLLKKRCSPFWLVGTLQAHKQKRATEWLPELIEDVWLGGRDSNPDRRIQSPQSYR